ncbi:hypothetical protein AB0I46_38620 [Streptomyces spectabilis]|uniref:hypothetical protein n=1 Tax=Streptomyces spectabilis TaxID=68270 RepID=UPI0033ECDDB9
MEDELGSQGAGGGSNDLSGTVHGHSVQAGHVAGDVTLNVLPPPAHPHVTPYEVPPLSARFFNQVDVLARLDALAAPGQGAPVGVAVLRGLPGVGTTAVIRRWAELKRAWFRGGQLYHDFAALRDRREGADVSEAAGQFLRSLGVDEPLIPDSLQERAARFRSRTAEQPLLVVLENVSRAAQVRALLPRGPGSVVLVTFGGDSGELGELSVEAQLVYVDPLDRASALRLLADRCARAVAADPEAAARVVELCGRLPLALDIVAGRLRTARSLTLARLADELADATHRLSGLSVGRSRSMTAALDLAYGALPPATARLYRLLGSLPLTALDESVAAAAAGTDLVDARAHLRELEALSLLEATEDGRHRVHVLVRLHAGERAEREDPPASGRAALARVLDHYLRLTALADRAVRRDRLRVADLTDVLRDAPDPFAAPGGPAPLAWLEAEYPNVLGVLRAAARDPELHVPVWQTAEALTSCSCTTGTSGPGWSRSPSAPRRPPRPSTPRPRPGCAACARAPCSTSASTRRPAPSWTRPSPAPRSRATPSCARPSRSSSAAASNTTTWRRPWPPTARRSRSTRRRGRSAAPPSPRTSSAAPRTRPGGRARPWPPSATPTRG